MNEYAAIAVCRSAIQGARADYNKTLERYLSWEKGRAQAAAFIFPTVETVSAANEVAFMVDEYWPRHREQK